MNDYLRMIQDRVEELQRMARNQDQNPVNEVRLREKLQQIMERCTEQAGEIERLTQP
jgi:hypothetical protein